MIFKPVPLGRKGLEKGELNEDRKNCKRFGPCGVGHKALYLNSFYFDCRYYIPYGSISRVFKRIAMSKGGFTRKGIFASIPYLVVVYDDGKEKQCNFKYEEQADQLLMCLEREHPEIKRLSASAEQRLAIREKERAARIKQDLSPQARKQIQKLQDAREYLNKRPELAQELSLSAKRKRAFLRSNPSYRWVAFAITILGLVSLLYGVYLFTHHGGFALYFTLFGLAAIFTFSGVSVLPTAKNNRKAIMGRAEQAVLDMERYLGGYRDFPLPARYAHPVVLQRMCRVIEEGRAINIPDTLEAVKSDLKALNSSVEVDQDEYDEVVTIKPMFLNEDYR